MDSRIPERIRFLRIGRSPVVYVRVDTHVGVVEGPDTISYHQEGDPTSWANLWRTHASAVGQLETGISTIADPDGFSYYAVEREWEDADLRVGAGL